MGGLESFLANAQGYIETSPWLAFAAVFLGGAMTAANPCVVAMVPLVIGLVGGYEGLSGWRRSLGFSFAFVAGLATTFTGMGVAAVLLGRLFGDAGRFWPWVVVLVCFAMAAHLWDLWSFSVPERLAAFRPKRAGLYGAFVLGLLFGFVSAPCAAPILAVVLATIAANGRLGYGLALLWTYAFGHCLLLIAVGVSAGFARSLLASERYRKINLLLKRSAGVVVALVGIWIAYQNV